jgi:NTE family protein
MIGLALSGGGSRAIAFHLGCLRALKDLGVLDEVEVLSTISGGSVIGALYSFTPELSFTEFDLRARQLLRTGFHTRIILELLKPQNLLHCLGSLLLTTFQSTVSLIPGVDLPRSQRFPTRTDCFANVLARELFPHITMSSPRRRNINVVIGACDLRTGSAFRFTNTSAGGWRHGSAIEWDRPVAQAVAASAAYPLLLPALDRTWRFTRNGHEETRRILLTDGGVYDNLGAAVLEPGRNADFSLHSFKCDHLIVCSAGPGQASGDALPLGFFSRLRRSFAVVHRRVQDSTLHSLHHLKEAGAIKGFALPYLGQQDDRLPLRPPDLIPRSHVMAYRTDFSPMSDHWIDMLSARGEQLTRALVSHYLPEICR